MKAKQIITLMLGLAFCISIIACGTKEQAENKTKLPEAWTEDAAVVSAMEGKVRLIRNNRKFNIKETGVKLRENDKVETAEGAALSILLKDRGVVQIRENSLFTVNKIEKNGDLKADLQKGKLLCALKKLEKKSTFTITTPTGVAGVRGTSFAIAADKNDTRLSVLTGKVAVKNKSGKETVVSEKKEASFSGNSISKPAIIRGKVLSDVKSILQIKGVEISGETTLMKKNIKALEIMDQKTIEEINAERKLEGRKIGTSHKDITVDSKVQSGADTIGEKDQEFESEDDMMIK